MTSRREITNLPSTRTPSRDTLFAGFAARPPWKGQPFRDQNLPDITGRCAEFRESAPVLVHAAAGGFAAVNADCASPEELSKSFLGAKPKDQLPLATGSTGLRCIDIEDADALTININRVSVDNDDPLLNCLGC